MMRDAEIRAIDWENVGHEELIRLCREWCSDAELFRRILRRALQLIFVDINELADEIGDDIRDVTDWLEGTHFPSEEWMLLILSDVIQTRLEAFKERLADIMADSARRN